MAPHPKPTPKPKKPGAMRKALPKMKEPIGTDLGAEDTVVMPRKMHVTAAGLREIAKRETPAKAKKTLAKADKQQAAAMARIAAKKSPTPKPAAPDGQTKNDTLVAMLKTPAGATSKEMEEATGWKATSVRGFLGTLRKKGVKVMSKKLPKEPTIYRIAGGKGKAAAPDPIGDVV